MGIDRLTLYATEIRIGEIKRAYLAGELPVDKAVEEINFAMGGITSAVYREKRGLKLVNHETVYALPEDGLSKRQLKALQGLAVAAYVKAQKNGSAHPGALCVSKTVSTKHRTGGLHDLIDRYA